MRESRDYACAHQGYQGLAARMHALSIAATTVGDPGIRLLRHCEEEGVCLMNSPTVSKAVEDMVSKDKQQ